MCIMSCKGSQSRTIDSHSHILTPKGGTVSGIMDHIPGFTKRTKTNKHLSQAVSTQVRLKDEAQIRGPVESKEEGS